MYYTKTTAGATITTAIPKVVKAPIPIPSQVVSAAVASRDVANLHAKEGATPVAKKKRCRCKAGGPSTVENAPPTSGQSGTQTICETNSQGNSQRIWQAGR